MNAGVHSHEEALVAFSIYGRIITPTLINKRKMKLTEFFTAP